MAFQIAGDGFQFRVGIALHHNGRRPENFFAQDLVLQKIGSAGAKHRGTRFGAAEFCRVIGLHLGDAVQFTKLFYALVVCRQNSRIEHRATGGFGNQPAQFVGEFAKLVSLQSNRQSRIGTELSDAHRHGSFHPFSQGVAAFTQSSRQNEHRICAAHFGIHRNRVRSRSRRVKQCPAAAQTACEPNRFGQRMFDQRRADFVAAIVQHRKDSGRHPCFFGGGGNRARHQFRRSGMRRMRFDHHRATSSQRRSRIASGHRKCQRKIAGSEHRHGPDGNQHSTNIRFRQRLAIRLRQINARFDPRTFANQRGEHFQLVHRATAFTGQPLFGQSGFDVGAFDQRIANRQNFIRDGVQKSCAIFRGQLSVRVKSFFGGNQCPIDVIG